MEELSFYGWNILSALGALFFYVFFRFGVDSFLRVKKHSKTFIRKNKHGFWNFWFYKGLHSQGKLGFVYYLNAVLLLLTLLYGCAVFALGWFEPLSFPIAIGNAVLCAVQIVAIIFSDMYQNLESKKKAFILFEIDKETKKINSSFITVLLLCLLLGFAIYNISIAL